MRFIEPIKEKMTEECVVALGFFDGVHLGHQALIKKCIEKSKELNILSCLYTFDIPPKKINGKDMIKEITTTKQKRRIIETMGIDIMAIDIFNKEFMSIAPKDFVFNILKDRLNAKCVIAGFHYTFGHYGAGKAEDLKRLCGECGIECIIIPPVMADGVLVSSSIIRTLVENGDVERAEMLMGRPFMVTNTVGHGKQIGRSIHTPTINIKPMEMGIAPSFGVYLTRTRVAGESYFGITNVGVRPTFGEFDNVTVETHLFDFSRDIYGQEIEVEFLVRIRSEKRFESVAELKNQIEKDIKYAKEIISSRRMKK